jgi:[NiFe] hydrogenase diaphorase moiety large subunit
MVKNNIVEAGPLVFSPENRGEALRKAVAVSPREVIRAVKAARLRGRGGAGFPTGMKWEFARSAPGPRKYLFCNADEGEPGTFKDRVILTERADRVFAGMTIAGYAIGAAEGIVYLRGEYAYLRPFLEERLRLRRTDGLLGRNVSGRPGFHFDIRIQMGAGAYVCGEESALINSCEGMRGDPRNRPPFPAQRGFLGCPTVVNNVETLACVSRILEDGPASFAEFGTTQSAGTKLFSVSGDCWRPGIYELPWGIALADLLARVGGSDAQAVQVGGPSGRMVGPSEFGRKLCFDDLATGGAIVVFGPRRNLLEIVRQYQAFFAEESCGYCVPCRVGNEILKRYLDRLLDGRAEPADIDGMVRAAQTMKMTSRCGLGQTACNPVLTSLESARHLYDAAVSEHPERFRRSFDLEAATATAKRLRDRAPVPAGHPGPGDWGRGDDSWPNA